MFDAIPSVFDEIADAYDTVGATFTDTVAARVVELAHVLPGEKVLDVGFGTGAVLIRVAKEVAPDGHVTGIDLSPRMLARASAASQREGVHHRVTLRLGDASSPDAAPESFDTIVSSLVLYLLPDPAAALASWHPLLIRGGSLVFSWSVRQDPRLLPVFGAIEKYNKGPSFLSYTERLPQPDGMKEWLHKCGYEHTVITAEVVTTKYHSPEHFWDQSVSQGPWVSWCHIPPDQLEQAKGDAVRLLEALCESDGTITRQTHIAYATACRPANQRDTGTHVI